MPSPETSSGPASSLTSALQLLRERWWVVALCLVLGSVVAVVNDSRKVDQYESTATLLFNTAGSNVSGLIDAAGSNISADPQRDQSTTLLLVQSSAVADRVRRALRYAGPSSDLSGAITASATADANLIDVTATDPDPDRAASLANAFAQQYQVFRREVDRSGVRQGIVSLAETLRTTPVVAQVQRQKLRDKITDLRAQEAGISGGVQLVDRATAPEGPASPRPRRDAVLGAILGLAVGAALIFVVDLLDRRLRKVPDFESAYATTALVAVPLRRRPARTPAELQAVDEPFRILRVSLATASSAAQPQVVLVTSAVPGEGKSTTAFGLAKAVAFAGRRVALVELDLRRPTFGQRFDLQRDVVGVTGLLQGQASLDEAMVHGATGLPTLVVIPAGGLPTRSAELISGPMMARMLDDLVERFDVVVLDAPPLLPVADTHALLGLERIDTCIVVGMSHVTTRDQARRARTTLLQHERRRYGLVVNGLRGDEGSYDYEYDAEDRTPLGTGAPAHVA